MTDQTAPPSMPTTMGEVNVTLSYIHRDISKINEKLETMSTGYITRADFEQHQKVDEDHEARIRVLEKESEDHALVKKVVYGAVGFILLAVLGAIVYLVIRR